MQLAGEAEPRRARGQVGARWEADGTTVRPHQAPRRGVLDRHAAADRQRRAAHRARLLATPTPTPSPASSGCAARRSSTRWAGTTTGCPPSAACRTSSASAATPRCPTTPTSAGPAAARSRAIADQPAELHRAVRGGGARGREGVPDLWRNARAVRRLGADVHHHRRPRRSRTSQRAFLRNLARGEAYGPRPPRCGTSTSARRWPRPSSRTGSCPGHTTGSCSTAPTAPGRSRPPGPSCCRPAWPGRRHPDDERYQPCFGQNATTPLFGVAVPVRRTRAGRPREGDRHRHDLHLRRHHRRHVVARAEPARRARCWAATAGSCPHRPTGWPRRRTPRPPTPSWPARP